MVVFTKPKNYEVVSYEKSYEDGGFMDDSPGWLKGLAIAGIVVGGLGVLGAAGYGCYRAFGGSGAASGSRLLNVGTKSIEEMLREEGWEYVEPCTPDTLRCYKGLVAKKYDSAIANGNFYIRPR